jgi:hypothetical protein
MRRITFNQSRMMRWVDHAEFCSTMRFILILILVLILIGEYYPSHTEILHVFNEQNPDLLVYYSSSQHLQALMSLRIIASIHPSTHNIYVPLLPQIIITITDRLNDLLLLHPTTVMNTGATRTAHLILSELLPSSLGFIQPARLCIPISHIIPFTTSTGH